MPASSRPRGTVRKPTEGGSVAQRHVPGPAGSVHVDDDGSGGLPVVFVHSFAGNASHFASQLQHLRAARRAVAFDLRGHGESEEPSGSDYAVESLARDIAAVVDALGLARFVLVGHGLGGSAAIAYAGDHPGRVAGLLLAVAPGKVPDQQSQQVMAAMRSNYEETSASYGKRMLAG